MGLVWSSEYPFLTIFAKKVKEKLNAIIKTVVFTSSIQATRALVLGDLELALTPAITQIHFTPRSRISGLLEEVPTEVLRF